jgi:hypothetical protein
LNIFPFIKKNIFILLFYYYFLPGTNYTTKTHHIGNTVDSFVDLVAWGRSNILHGGSKPNHPKSTTNPRCKFDVSIPEFLVPRAPVASN